MSHLRKCVIDIKNPNPAILKKAMDLIAKELGCTPTTNVYDFYYRTKGRDGLREAVLAGFSDKTLCPGGYGVRITNGQIECVGDPHLESSEYRNPKQYPFDSFTKRVVQAYNAVAYQRQLLTQNFSTKISYKQETKQYVLAAVQ